MFSVILLRNALCCLHDCAGENRCTRDGEQRSTVEQGSGWGCEKAQGKGLSYIYHIHMYVHTHTLLQGMSNMPCVYTLCKHSQNLRIKIFQTINNPLVMFIYVCVYISISSGDGENNCNLSMG